MPRALHKITQDQACKNSIPGIITQDYTRVMAKDGSRSGRLLDKLHKITQELGYIW